MTKSEIIDSIIDDDIDTIVEDHENFDDHGYLNDLLQDGMKGYRNFTDQELIVEYNERFKEQITEVESD